jgi:uncharacterized membrane protein YgcG
MTDYSSLTVKDLKEELKKRSIPQTGLTRKQQIIDRLLQHDTENSAQQTEAVTDTGPTLDPAPRLPQYDGPSDDAELPIARQAAVPPVVSSVEKPAPSPTIAASTNSTPGGDDSRKRKRRSLTPAVVQDEVTKKLKHDGAEPIVEDTTAADLIADAPIVIGKPDTTINLGAGITETETVGKPNDSAEPTATAEIPDAAQNKEEAAREARQPAVAPVPPILEEVQAENMDLHEKDEPVELKQQTPEPETKIQQEVEARTPTTKDTAARDHRYKDLFSPSTALAADVPMMDRPIEEVAEEQERVVQPATHPATTAIYIRDLMRPLQPQTLEDQIKLVAAKPGSTIDEEIVDFHLDAIRTHAFVSFTSLAAAARVRSALHDLVWPAERGRKPLWVDFIPEDKVRDWIKQETDSGEGRAARNRRWEVIYEKANDGTVEAIFQEIGPQTQAAQQINAPTAPRSMLPHPEIRREAAAAPQKKPESAQFLALDTLFSSTTTKPKLYFLPVSKDIADTRLRELEDKTGGAGKNVDGSSGLPDSRRYTWEDGKIVDSGPEFGLRREKEGGRGGFRGGGGGGGYRGGGGGRGRYNGDAYRPGRGDEYRPRERY